MLRAVARHPGSPRQGKPIGGEQPLLPGFQPFGPGARPSARGGPPRRRGGLARAIALREGLDTIGLEARYDLARNHALLAGLAAEDGSALAPTEAQNHSDRAIEVLKRVVAEGYRPPRMRSDPDFDSLRRRPDFQLLVLDRDFPAKPFAATR